ncbi:MAG: hypothetical protein HC778_06570 [Chamaesiphon sp. CSU_1_12]|nr:hypothetical protein [Chamaesiphon sp. CSU_1_12]
MNEIEEIAVSEVKPAKLKLKELGVLKLNVSPVESVMVKGIEEPSRFANPLPTAFIPEGRVATIAQPEQLRILVPEPKFSPGSIVPSTASISEGVPNPLKAVKVTPLIAKLG